MTAQDWIDKATALLTRARAAAAAKKTDALRASAEDCSDFIATRTLACPQDVVDAVYGAQVELSQLIVATDAGSIKSRTTQLDAYLQDLQRIAAQNKKDADRISFSSAKKVVDGLTGIVKDVNSLQTSLTANATSDTQIAAAAGDLLAIAGRLTALQSQFAALAD